MMAVCSLHKACPKPVSSCLGWVKGLSPSSTLQALPTLQRQAAFPFFSKQHQCFSLLQCIRTVSKPVTHGARRFTTQIQAGDLLRPVFLETVKLSSRLSGREALSGNRVKRQCGFGTSSAASQLGMGSGGSGHESEHHSRVVSTPREEDWALRFANENGFLSWCRNSYLTTVIAIAMLAEGTTPLSLQAAEGAFFVAGLNLTWGTYQYIYNLLRLRRRTGMSAVGTLMYVSMALLHIALWFVVCSLFLGYTDEPESKLVREEEKNAQKGDDV